MKNTPIDRANKPRLQWAWNGWYCFAAKGWAVWGATPKIAYSWWLTHNPWAVK